MITHEEISKRAREIWEREGRPEGRDKEHWLQAESELRQESSNNGPSEQNAAARTDSILKMPSLKEENSRKRARRSK